MLWPWMPPAAGAGSSGRFLEGAVVVEEPPAGVELWDCASAVPARAAVSAAAARSSRNLRIVVLPLDGTDLQLLFPAVAVAGLPARDHERMVGALEGRGIGLDAVGGLLALGAGGQHDGEDDEREDGEGSHDLPPWGWPACLEP